MSEEEVEEEGDDDIPYNPKNLPLGWDGEFASLNSISLNPKNITENVYSRQASLSPTGFTSYTASTSLTTVRFVETSPTKDPRLSRDILQVDSFTNLSSLEYM